MEWLVPILDAVLGSLVRSGLMLITGFLIERHLVSQQVADQFVTDGVAHVIIAVPALLALVWSIWSKVKGRARFLTALQATPGTTEAQIKDKVDSGMGVSVKAGVLLLACVLGASASACGPKSYHAAVVADVSLSQALFSLDDAESAAFKAQLITPAKHAIYSAQILKLLKAGDDLTLALKAWDPSQPAPANIGAALGEVQGLLADLKIDSPKASQAIFAAETVLSVLRGSGVLPAPDDVAEASEGWIIVEIKYWFGSELSFGPVFKNDVVHFDRLAVDVDNRAAGAVVLRHGQILLPAVARG